MPFFSGVRVSLGLVERTFFLDWFIFPFGVSSVPG